MPNTFLTVSGSFIIIKEIISTSTGLVVIIIAAFIGVDKFKPWKNNNWFIATPNNPQINNLTKSCFSTFSLIYKKYIKENKITAPVTLKNIKPEGLM